jgi:ferredoxin-NADP reductase/ferredoxin
MSYSIILHTQDAQQIEFSCEPGQTVQEAAEQAGYNPPTMCRDGKCGTCLANCRSGKYHLDHYSESALSQQAAEHGDILLCQTHPDSDLQVQVPYDAMQLQSIDLPPRTATINAINIIAARTVQLIVQLEEDASSGLSFNFTPGQYVELEIPDMDLKRAYSMANTSNLDGRLEFLIRLQPKGRFSEFLQQAQVGMQLIVHGPSGLFTIRENHLNPRCFIAGGTGLAPFLSMLRRMLEWGEDHPTHLILGVNNEAEILCQDELNTLQNSLPQFSMEICVWKPQQRWTGFVGTPVDALQIYLKNTAEMPDIYLCGPPILVESATKFSLDAGINEQHIFSERFVTS